MSTERRLPDAVDIYDTTLRDGSQQEGISLTVDDKLHVAEQLDHLGVAYIEGGWPGANPKDEEFFARAATRSGSSDRDPRGFRFDAARGGGRGRRRDAPPPVEAGTKVVCIVAKASDLHVTEALRTTLDEAIAMAADSVAHLRTRASGIFRRRALLRRLPAGTRSSPSTCSPRPRRPERRSWCSATPTGARCPTRSSGS